MVTGPGSALSPVWEGIPLSQLRPHLFLLCVPHTTVHPTPMALALHLTISALTVPLSVRQDSVKVRAACFRAHKPVFSTQPRQNSD